MLRAKLRPRFFSTSNYLAQQLATKNEATEKPRVYPPQMAKFGGQPVIKLKQRSSDKPQATRKQAQPKLDPSQPVTSKESFAKFREQLHKDKISDERLFDSSFQAKTATKVSDIKGQDVFTVDPTEASGRAMFEHLEGSTGIPLAKIKPVKKAFPRQPYVDIKDRTEKDLGFREKMLQKKREESQLAKADTIAAVDSRVHVDFLEHSLDMAHDPEGRKAKTVRQQVTWLKTRGRKYQNVHHRYQGESRMDDTMVWTERWLIESEVRRAEFIKWCLTSSREYSARRLMNASFMPDKLTSILYASRFQNQTGTWMLFFPSAFGVALSGTAYATQLPLIATMLWTSYCARSAAQVFYQIQNVNIDKRINRSKARPLATGAITQQEAYASLGLHALGAALPFAFLPASCGLIAAGLVPLALLGPKLSQYTKIWGRF